MENISCKYDVKNRFNKRARKRSKRKPANHKGKRREIISKPPRPQLASETITSCPQINPKGNTRFRSKLDRNTRQAFQEQTRSEDQTIFFSIIRDESPNQAVFTQTVAADRERQAEEWGGETEDKRWRERERGGGGDGEMRNRTNLWQAAD